MALSALAIPKFLIPELRSLPRDMFNSLEAQDPGALPAILQRTLLVQDNAVGLDLDIYNSNAVAGTAIIILDNSVTITLAPGQAKSLENILFGRWTLQRAAAGVISVNLYWAGVSNDLLQILTKRMK